MNHSNIEAAIAALSGEPMKKTVNKRDCQLCGYEKSVGKYYLEKSESENYGWWRVCSHCASMVENHGADVRYYKYSKEYREQCEPNESLPNEVLDCSHKWEKWALVGEHDKKRDSIFDWMRCGKCKVYGKRFYLDQTEMDDLTMEIDLSCSR